MNATDFFCGLLAGWGQVIVGQPLDFIKVKIQTAQKAPVSTVQVAKEIYKTYGLKGFYRGSSSLFFGFACTIGTEFLVLEWSKRWLYYLDSSRPASYDPNVLSMKEISVAGGIVGAVVAFIYCPVQYAKIQRQMSNQVKISSFRLLLKEIANNGIKNIYKGGLTTLLRETYGSMIYYSTYEGLVKASHERREKASSWVYLGAGAAAGIGYHLFTYPIDTVKSNIQAGMKFKQALRNSLQLSKLEGYKPVLIRAMLVNACNFWIYQQAQQYVYFFNNCYYSPY